MAKNFIVVNLILLSLDIHKIINIDICVNKVCKVFITRRVGMQIIKNLYK